MKITYIFGGRIIVVSANSLQYPTGAARSAAECPHWAQIA